MAPTLRPMAVGRGMYRREREVFRALLRAAREEAGLRQQDLANRLGRPQSYVSKIESGERRVDVVELGDVCAALGLRLGDFVQRLEAALAEAHTRPSEDSSEPRSTRRRPRSA